jgi:hypothetical protein
MKAEEFLKEKSDWFDKSPGGEKLYFESEVIRMMNEYANEALRIHAVSGRSEQLFCDCKGNETNKYYDDSGVKRCWECRKEAK